MTINYERIIWEIFFQNKRSLDIWDSAGIEFLYAVIKKKPSY